MLSNYFKIAVRTLARSKAFSLINVTGLTVGMTCWILILLYVLHESNFDAYHPNAGRIYRVEVAHWATAPMAIAPYMTRHFPETEKSVRFLRVTRASVGRALRAGGARSQQPASALPCITGPGGPLDPVPDRRPLACARGPQLCRPDARDGGKILRIRKPGRKDAESGDRSPLSVHGDGRGGRRPGPVTAQV